MQRELLYCRHHWVLMVLLLIFSFPSHLRADETDLLREHVRVLSSMNGRKAGTEDGRAAAGYIYGQLSKAGVNMLDASPGSEFSLTLDNGDTLNSVNVVGVVEGYDPLLKNQYIIVGAGYDGQGVGSITIDGVRHDVVYPGAYSNASGVSVLIEIARRVEKESFMFRRSVVFVAFGAEESGLLGSWYFLNGGFSGLKDVSLMFNLDMIGRRKTGNELGLFMAGAEKQLSPFIEEMQYEQTGISPDYLSLDPRSSSHRMFYASHIPVVCFTSGMSGDVYSTSDKPDKLDYGSMYRSMNYIYGFLMKAANYQGDYSAVHSSDKVEEDDDIFSVHEVDEVPEFLNGGTETFLQKWVYRYVKYPESSIRNGVRGTVIVEFCVEKDGRVTDVKIAKGLDDAIDAEVLKVVSASPKWKPGKAGGMKRKVKMSVPVEFRLR